MADGASPPPPRDPREVVVAFMRAWSDGAHGAWDHLVVDDFVNHPSPPGMQRGREAFRAVIGSVATRLADQRVDVHAVISEGDLVAVRCTYSAREVSEGPGGERTGKSFSVEHSHWFRMEDGRIAEHWAVRDDLGMMRQLGLIDS